MLPEDPPEKTDDINVALKPPKERFKIILCNSLNRDCNLL